MFAATLQPSAVAYREEQNFSWWVYALMAVMAGGGIAFAVASKGRGLAGASGGMLEVPIVVFISLLLPTILVVGVLRLTTEVDPGRVCVTFGWVPTFHRAISLADLDRVEEVRYRPLLECGGWGIRRGRGGERIYNARGDRGVRLHFKSGATILIGSQHPQELAEAITRCRPPEA